MCIAAVLPPHQFDLRREVLVHHGVVKHEIPGRRLRHLRFHVLPHQTGSNLVSGQITVGGIVTELLRMFGKIGQRIVDLADQQVLAIVDASNWLVYGFHEYLS